MKGVRHSLSAAVAAFLVLLVGCYPVRQRAARHPTRAATEVEEALALRVEHWEPADAFRKPTPIERTVEARLTAGLGTAAASDEVDCIARETAAFFGRYRALPDEILQLWLAGYCGAPASPFFTLWMERDIPAAGDPNPLGPVEAQWLDALKRAAPSLRFGVGAGLRASRLVVVVSMTFPSVEVHRRGPDENGLVRLEGHLLEDADVLRAVINQGATGTAACTNDDTVELPEFDITCQMAAGDHHAFIDLIAGTGQMLEGPVGQVLARRRDAHVYQRPIVRLPRRSDPVTALVDGINVLRAHAGLGELRREFAEMRLMSSLYPAAFRADTENDQDSLNRFYDELHAGRAVSGILRWSSTYHQIAYAGNASDWLAKMLFLPGSRETLFMPRAESIALLTHVEPGVGFGAAIATYSFFRDSDDTERAKLVYDTLRRLRTEDGVTTTLLDPPEELVLEAQRVKKGELPPDEALRSALAAINAHSKRTFTGVWFRVPWNADPENLPEPLFEPETLECAIVSTHRKPPDHAWGEQVVFVVYPISGKPA
ncbi:MAG TPA: hypothetical protein VNN72_05650 [Polyangiaceae bacterium]|nr:hypothetical protein [Polyangiaceae bacterium]